MLRARSVCLLLCRCRLLCCRLGLYFPHASASTSSFPRLCFAAYLAYALGELILHQPVHGNLQFLIAFLLFHALLHSCLLPYISDLLLAARYARPTTLAAGASSHFVLQVAQAGRLAGLTPFGVIPTNRQQFSIVCVPRQVPHHCFLDFPPDFFDFRLFSSLFLHFTRFCSIISP